MAPIYVKGGIWTNIEDEILKAAVSKYGLNQWSRVASLLPKKSPKQVKARWNEWLNPQVNKNNWTLEQDEKLLNLVKLLPNQWRTIASVLGGRSATHCVERYQKLISDATEEDEFKLTGPGIETLPATGAVTGAGAVGDLNINPESKPARPDEEDLEDNEREMLAEAKARLANTQGKKAKRKARERMLEESKRIAILQKRRELKAAGFNISLKSRNKKKRLEFDYNGDILFEKEVPQGVYDVSEELQSNKDEKVKFSNKVAKRGIEMESSGKKQEKKTSAKKHQIESGEVNEPKRQKLNLSPPEPLQGDTRILHPAKATILSEKSVPDRKIKASITKLLKSALSNLPTPKTHSTTVIPNFDSAHEEIIYLETPNEDQGELFRNLKLLQQLNEEKSKLLRSQVIQRGYEIPNPNNLQIFHESNDLLNLINQEYINLIKSDYRKYKDTSYQGKLVEDLSQDLFEKVNTEIDQELANIDKQKREFTEYVLPKISAKKVLANLEEIKNRSSKAITQLDSSEYETKRDKLVQSIQETYKQLVAADEQYEFVLKRLVEEDIIIQNETSRLEHVLNRLTKSTDLIQQQFRELTVKRLTN